MTKFVVVLPFDIPDDREALNRVVMAIQSAGLPYLEPMLHVALADMADKVLAIFDKESNDDDSSTAIQKDKG